MTLAMEMQVALRTPGLPKKADLQHWVTAALTSAGYTDDAEMVIRIVDEAESTALNQSYRHKQGATNVLSFPFEAIPGVDVNLLGDIVICAPVVLREAVLQHKDPMAHWAHIVTHGVLHLLGYDHQNGIQAKAMEALESRILTSLGYPDPYGDFTDS
jgi:probable rRNA maturation factor